MAQTDSAASSTQPPGPSQMEVHIHNALVSSVSRTLGTKLAGPLQEEHYRALTRAIVAALNESEHPGHSHTGTRTRPTAYTVSLLPETDPDFSLYAVNVERDRGTDQWKIRFGTQTLRADGTWGHDGPCRCRRPHPAPRFALGKALDLAQIAAPGVTFNGRAATDAYRLAQE